jgi:phage tail sheath protein FI
LNEKDVFNIYQEMLGQCERLRDRVAILDPPAAQKPKQVVEWRNKFNSRFGALYYPWLKVPESLNANGKTRLVPPSGHVAGVYARIDNQFGVHRPPANASLEFVTDVADEITAIQQEELNPFDVNAIRPFSGRGIRVWGARSLAERSDSDWRFIHARRLMSMIEESVYKSMQWAVFEPNDFALRRTLVHSLSVFLEQIWRQGGLKGALMSEAFYVKCDETNNPPSVIDAGQIVCQVGIAVAAPMEFIIFEIRRGPSGTQITESEE